MIKCSNCGNEIREGTKFCSKCGSNILEQQEKRNDEISNASFHASESRQDISHNLLPKE